jgi:hypothetical protein
MKLTWKELSRLTILLLAVTAIAGVAPPSWAAIPDANIQAGVNRGGFGILSGAYGQADFAVSERAAVGAYFGVDPNDVFLGDYTSHDRTFDSDVLIGGHYMYQFVEGTSREPSVAGIFGAFANRAGLRPEFGFGLSYPFDARWTGRANVVYGPSWGFEMGYRFNPQVEGTFGITGMGVLGLKFRF